MQVHVLPFQNLLNRWVPEIVLLPHLIFVSVVAGTPPLTEQDTGVDTPSTTLISLLSSVPIKSSSLIVKTGAVEGGSEIKFLLSEHCFSSSERHFTITFETI